MTNMNKLSSIVSSISKLREELEEMNAYEEGFAGRGVVEMDCLIRCVDCTDKHLCIDHCDACNDQNETCEREEVDE